MRDGLSIWEACDEAQPPWRSAPLHADVDVAIIGAGITGAFLAERFTRAGWRIAVLDGRAPQKGATAASTALVMWETDAPLMELEQRIGLEAAANIWRRCAAAIGSMSDLAHGVGAACEAQESLLLAGDLLDAAQLKGEAQLRRRAGLPSVWEPAETIYARDRVKAQAALRSAGALALNPIRFSRALLKRAQARGAYIYDGGYVDEFDVGEHRVRLQTRSGRRVCAEALVLATGYEMPPLVPPIGHRVDSTWVIALPLAAPPKRLIWEASRTYAYLRAVGDYVIIGGEDERGMGAEERNRLTPVKARRLSAKLSALLPGSAATPELAWSAFFGATEDGLPLIGPVPGAPRTYAAYGYGGNGITFSALAAELLFGRLSHTPDPLEPYFALDRF